MSLCKLVLYFVACILLHPSHGQQLQCSADIVTTSPNGTIEFGPLSDGAGPVDASFDPGAIGGWNALANGFVNAVQMQDLPYDLIIPVINTTFIINQSAFDPLSLLQNFASWWAGILVVTLLGIFFGILFCIVGGCFWCCRCCGNCGGSKSQETRENNDCLTFTFASILFLCTLVLLAGAILAFFSNEQTFRSLENFRTTLNGVIQDGSNYINDTATELDELICQFSSDDGTLGAVMGEINGIQGSLSTTIDSISNELSVLINQLNSSAIVQVSGLIDDVTTEFTAVESTVSAIDTSLLNVVANLGSALTSCMGAGLGAQCDPIQAARDAASTAQQAIPTLPDLTSQLSDIQTAISGIGGNIMQGQNTLMMALGPQITDQLNTAISQVTPFLTQANDSFTGLSSALNLVLTPLINTQFSDVCPPLDTGEAFSNIFFSFPDFSAIFSGGSVNVATPPMGSVPLSLGYINECVINAAFSLIGTYDVYRYAIGIIICCLALLTIVLMWIGMLLGLIGFKKDLYPYDRSSLSHCGGICLLISVGFTFLFGFLLLLISAIFFFLGSNSLILCQSFQGPDYSIFANTIDNPSIKSAFIPSPFDTAIPSVSGILRECEVNNSGLYTAFRADQLLSTLLPGGVWAGSIEATLTQTFNLTNLRNMVDAAIITAASSLNIDESAITGAIEQALNQLPNDTLNINVSSFAGELQTAVDSADINASITALISASVDLTAAGQMAIAVSLNNSVASLEDVRDTLVPLLTQQLAQLQTTLDALSIAADTLRQNVTATAAEIGQTVATISGPVLDTFINETVRGSIDRSFGFVFQYIRHLDDQIVSSVGGCQPVYGVYTQLHNTVCRNFLEGLNGFWWGLGFCALLFVPVIIFAVLTSSFFLKKKAVDGDDGAYEGDYPMKGY